jgi:type IV pilus assembly protein PilQ
MPSLAAALLLILAVTQASSDGRPSGSQLVPEETVAATHNLTGVSVDSSVPGRTDVVLAVDGEVAYESLVLDGPDRLVLDLQGVVSRLDRYKFPVNRAGIVRVRAAQNSREPWPVARVVFDLERPLSHTIDQRASTLVVSFDTGSEGVAAATDAQPRAAPAAGEAETTAVADLVREMESRFEPAPDVPDTGPAADAETGFADPDRRVEPDLLERLMGTPVLAAPAPAERASPLIPDSFKTKTIVTDQVIYSGTEISLNLVDADVKQVFRLFHEISGLNFVLDPSVGGQVTIVLDHVPWDQALDIILKNNGLDKQLEHNVIRIASTKKLAQEAAERKNLKEAKELEVEPITITRTLSYAKSKDVERVIRDSGVLSGRGKVIVDERTNTLIISDIPKKVTPLDTLISTLDSETPQVMIEARIVETSRDFVRDLGVVWGFEAIAASSKGTSTGLTFPHNAAVKYGLNLPGEGGASALAFKFGNVLDSFTLDLQLNTLEAEGRGRILSAPKVATQNNERAEIEQGVRIPVVNTTATEINVEFVSASLRMQVTPQITAEGTIILDVVVENNSPDFVNTAGDVPSIRTQRAQTKVLINDGGTTVIGGIFTVNEGHSEVGVPWFRKVPVFGWLFKQQNITNQNRELLIFITPKIIRVS